MTNQERIILALLACVNFTHILDFMIMMPLGPNLMDVFAITPQQFSGAVSAYSITAGISGFISAFFADRFDRKKILLFAYTGFVIGTFACALSPTYWFLVMARVLAGFFGGMIGAQVLSIVGDQFEYDRRARAMGVVMTAFSLASVVGVPLGLWMAARTTWHAPFWFVGLLGLVNIILLMRFLPPMTKHLVHNTPDRNPMHVLRNIAQSPNQMRALLLSVVVMLGHFSIIPFITPSLVANAGFSRDNVFLIYLVGGALTIFTSPLVGKLADKRGKYPVFVLFAALSLVPVWLITNLSVVPLWVVLIISGIFFIFVNGRMVPMQAMVSSVASPEQRGGFMAINSSVTQLASGASAMIAGAMVHQVPGGPFEHYERVGYFAISLLIFAIWVAKDIKKVD